MFKRTRARVDIQYGIAGGRFVVEITADLRDEKAAEAVVRQTRRELERELRRVAIGLAREQVLPRAQQAAPKRSGRLARSYRIYRGKRNRLFVRSSVPYAAVVDYGGTLRDPIIPKKKRAVVVNGQPVARVNTPRKFPRRERVQKAVERAREPFARALQNELARAIDRFVKARI